MKVRAKRSFSIVLKGGSTIDFPISRFLESIPRQGNTANYDDYLLSDDWQFKRLQVFERDGWVCVYCYERASDVHHKTYKNFGDESLGDLQTVVGVVIRIFTKDCFTKQNHDQNPVFNTKTKREIFN